jgi:5-carboxymethyl-2-hydroxymuconate isomerase
MPHITVEYSANVEEHVRIDAFLKVLQDAAFSTGVAELAGFRTRAERRDQYRVADGNPANCFVAITIRVARGRSADDLKNLRDTVTKAATNYLEPVFTNAPISFSCEVQEIIPEMRVNISNIREWMKKQEDAA